MCKVVIDTNIIISAAISDRGNPAKIMNFVSDGRIIMYYSPEILNEYAEILSRDKFKFSVDKQKAVIEKIIEIGFLIEPAASNIQLPDESDRKFYDTAAEAKACLITGNTRHFPKEAHIVTPAQFIEIHDL